VSDLEDERDEDKPTRITDLELLEISVVPLPANRGATFEMAKSLKDRFARPAKEPEPEPEEPTDIRSDDRDAEVAAVEELVRELIVGSVPSFVAGARLLGHEITAGGD
jgi:hypothetical protein